MYFYRQLLSLSLWILLVGVSLPAAAEMPSPAPVSLKVLAQKLAVGDIIFIHVDILPFNKIAHDTMSWTNHVGIVTETTGEDPLIAESTVPVSRQTRLSHFIKRSQAGRVAIGRLPITLDNAQIDGLHAAVSKRLGLFYDTGFNLHSRGQFCSRFVYEVVKESTGLAIGKVETLRMLFAANPDADLAFWRTWYLGKIPWDRETVTPASILRSPELKIIFDGYVL